MNRVKAFSIPVFLVMLAVTLAPGARADEWNKKTNLTVNEQVVIPGGKVLEPGKYVMKLMDSQANRHIVQIFNEDESQLITTVIAIPNQRLQPTGKTEFGFWEMPAGQPKALRSWFYPGDNFGQEFAYPKDMAAQIAKASHESVPAITSGENDVASAEVGRMSPEGTLESEGQSASAQAETTQQPSAAAPPPDTTASAQATTPSTESSTTASTPPAPSTDTTAQSSTPTTPSADMSAQTPTSQTGSSGAALPSTASPFPLVGLGGLLAAGSAMMLRVTRRRR